MNKNNIRNNKKEKDQGLKRKGQTVVSNPAGRWRIEGIYDIPRRFRKETKHENAQHSCLVNSQDGYVHSDERPVYFRFTGNIYQLFLIRPAQPPSSTEGRYNGWLASPLCFIN